MKIRAFIVDDEPLARERIWMMLRDEADVQLAGECGDGTEAVALLKREKPDLLFLDVQMPGMDGFEVLRNLSGGPLPVVIFTTAFDQHAVRAFDAHALDYLLKPFKPARFKAALQRARELLADKQAGATTRGLLDLLAERPAANTHLTRLAVKTEDKVIFVNVSDIDTIESAGNYAVVNVGKESHILRDTLNHLETKLRPDRFFRVSRSIIVNVERIKEIQPMFKGENVIVLKSGKQLATTRPIREIQERLEFL